MPGAADRTTYWACPPGTRTWPRPCASVVRSRPSAWWPHRPAISTACSSPTTVRSSPAGAIRMFPHLHGHVTSRQAQHSTPRQTRDGNGRLGYTVTAGQGEPRLIPALADKVATVIAAGKAKPLVPPSRGFGAEKQRVFFCHVCTAGEAHSLVATEDGCVFTFGLNARSQLGFGPDAQKESSTQRLENLPTDISKVHAICLGVRWHTLTRG